MCPETIEIVASTLLAAIFLMGFIFLLCCAIREGLNDFIHKKINERFERWRARDLECMKNEASEIKIALGNWNQAGFSKILNRLHDLETKKKARKK